MEYPQCPKCKSKNTYFFEDNYICPDCSHEWSPNSDTESTVFQAFIVKDANGVELKDGDTVITIKNIPVKGSSKPIKIGTKIKNIKLTEGEHNIACKIDGFGAIALKSEFVKKG